MHRQASLTTFPYGTLVVNLLGCLVIGVLAGATVLPGLEGFGARSRLHTAKLLRLSSYLPVLVEIVDTEEKIESFLPLIDVAIGEGLATVERVEVRSYRSGKSENGSVSTD